MLTLTVFCCVLWSLTNFFFLCGFGNWNFLLMHRGFSLVCRRKYQFSQRKSQNKSLSNKCGRRKAQNEEKQPKRSRDGVRMLNPNGVSAQLCVFSVGRKTFFSRNFSRNFSWSFSWKWFWRNAHFHENAADFGNSHPGKRIDPHCQKGKDSMT